MILIWDNGRDYSSHDIEFMELGDISLDDAVSLLRIRYEDGYVIGTADRIDWRAQGSIGNILDFVSPFFDLGKAGEVSRDLCLRVLNHEDRRLRVLLEDTKQRTDKWKTTVEENLKHSLAELSDARVALEASTRK